MGKFKSRKIGFILGILIFILLLIMPTPEGLTPVGQKVLASSALMVVFWVTEAIPIPMTALLPILIYPLINISGTKAVNDVKLFTHYAYPTVYLVLGVSFLSTAMVKWNFHRRIALWIVKKVGSKPSRIILGFILATGVVSMWMSNTTATAMMLPVAVSILASLPTENKGFKIAMILAIPYAATIGGMSTVIGTTTNPTGIGLIKEAIGLQITFFDWLKIGLPFSVIITPLLWLFLVKFYRVDKMESIDVTTVNEEYEKLGPMSKGERYVATVFVIAIVLWMTSILWGKYVPLVSDETIALFIAVLLIIIPVNFKEGEYVLDMKTALKEAPWSTVILLGGSMVMGNAFKDAGVAKWIAQNLTGLSSVPPFALVMIVGVITAIITEVTTNAVVVAAFLPALAGIASGVGMSPLALMLTCMLASNFAFMLPPATPPNAIAYGTGLIDMKDLIKAGLGFKIICIIMFPIIMYLLTMGLFGVGA